MLFATSPPFFAAFAAVSGSAATSFIRERAQRRMRNIGRAFSPNDKNEIRGFELLNGLVLASPWLAARVAGNVVALLTLLQRDSVAKVSRRCSFTAIAVAGGFWP